MLDRSALRWGRHVEHDDRSRDYPVAMCATRRPTDVLWPRYGRVLNQGGLGACTGMAMAAWLQCAPHCRTVADASQFTEEYAIKLYSLATELDDVPGSFPPDDTGSTGLGVAKAARRLGEISVYRWAFTTAELLQALQHGPVLAGMPWLSGMMRPNRRGTVSVSGNLVGGHEVLVRGFQDGRFVLSNSWGPEWGVGGDCRLNVDGWERLRRMRADVVVPVI